METPPVLSALCQHDGCDCTRTSDSHPPHPPLLYCPSHTEMRRSRCTHPAICPHAGAGRMQNPHRLTTRHTEQTAESRCSRPRPFLTLSMTEALSQSAGCVWMERKTCILGRGSFCRSRGQAETRRQPKDPHDEKKRKKN